MKTNIKAAIMVFALAAVAAFSFAFRPAGPNHSQLKTLVYSYNLSTPAGARNPANWTLISSSAPSCGTPGDTPCRVVFDSSEFADINAYLNAQHFSSDDDVAFGPGVTRKE